MTCKEECNKSKWYNIWKILFYLNKIICAFLIYFFSASFSGDFAIDVFMWDEHKVEGYETLD